MRLAAQNCVAERTLFKGQLHARFVILFYSLKYLVLFINGQSSCLSLLNMPSRVPLPLGSDEVAKCSSFDELIVLLRCPMCWSVSLFPWRRRIFGEFRPWENSPLPKVSVRAVDRALRTTAPKGPILEPPLEISKNDWPDFSFSPAAPRVPRLKHWKTQIQNSVSVFVHFPLFDLIWQLNL